ncbi:hypothetical protein CL653_00300 [bacterium]|nr:hypothetical protein [bacterium]
MTEKIKNNTKLFAAFLIAVIAVMLVAGFLGYRSFILQKDLSTLRQAYSELDNNSLNTIVGLESELATVQNSLAEMENSYREAKRQNDDFEEEYRQVINTVYDLDKLSKTDEELLQKYSKVYFLNENYIPSRLQKISDEYILPGRSEQYFHVSALPFLEDLLEEAQDDGLDLKVISAYRSFDQQADLKGSYTQTYGSGANTFSADQGYSEHQLGTTLDISDAKTAGPYLSFAETDEYQWLSHNAYRYGFVLSYPKNNTFYVYEPWHWRFVGTELAEYLNDNDLHFYDLDQRTIDQYLINIFD